MTVDKIIIGAGLYGLYAAQKCGAAGQRVLVLERDPAPFMRRPPRASRHRLMALRGRRRPNIPTPHPRARLPIPGLGPMVASRVAPDRLRPSKTRSGPEPSWSQAQPANDTLHPSRSTDVPARGSFRRPRWPAMSARGPGGQPSVRCPIGPRRATRPRSARASNSGTGGSNNVCNGNSRTGCGLSESKPNWSAHVP